MSPGVLANLWKEEETRTKQLEDNMKALLRDKGVSLVQLLVYLIDCLLP